MCASRVNQNIVSDLKRYLDLSSSKEVNYYTIYFSLFTIEVKAKFDYDIGTYCFSLFGDILLFLISHNIIIIYYNSVLKFQICVPMSVEFEELAKLRENPAEDFTSIYFFYFLLNFSHKKNLCGFFPPIMM